MNEHPPGYWLGFLIGGAGAGAIAGLLPLFLGVRKDRTSLAIGGFLASVAAGMAAGIIGASVVVVFFSAFIQWQAEPAGVPSTTPADMAKTRTALG